MIFLEQALLEIGRGQTLVTISSFFNNLANARKELSTPKVVSHLNQPLYLWVESHPSFPRQSQKSIALLPILSKFSMYDVKMLNESCSEFGDTHLTVGHGFIIQACLSVTYLAEMVPRRSLMTKGQESDLNR